MITSSPPESLGVIFWVGTSLGAPVLSWGRPLWKVLTCFFHLHLLDQLAVLRFPQVTLQIESTADSRVGDNGHEDLGAIDLLPLPPASLSLSLSLSFSQSLSLSLTLSLTCTALACGWRLTAQRQRMGSRGALTSTTNERGLEIFHQNHPSEKKNELESKTNDDWDWKIQ